MERGRADPGQVMETTYRQPSLVKPYPMVLMWLPMVVHSAPLMMPMALTDRIVKKRSRSARSFQFLFIVTGDQSAMERQAVRDQRRLGPKGRERYLVVSKLQDEMESQFEND